VVVGDKCAEVAGEGGLDVGIVFPLRFVGQAALQFIQGEGQLERHRVLRPEGAVVVEDGDALGGGDEVGGFFVCHAADVTGHGFFGLALAPRGKRVRRRSRRGYRSEGEGPQRERSAPGGGDCVSFLVLAAQAHGLTVPPAVPAGFPLSSTD
jgi:hypothetical protein